MRIDNKDKEKIIRFLGYKNKYGFKKTVYFHPTIKLGIEGVYGEIIITDVDILNISLLYEILKKIQKKPGMIISTKSYSCISHCDIYHKDDIIIENTHIGRTIEEAICKSILQFLKI